tara:strand:- start:201 stop:683 length:483 start_codon:yes stop_codon:yes gene_type:complete
MIGKIFNKLKIFFKMPLKYKAFVFLSFWLCGIAKLCINLFPRPKVLPYLGVHHKNHSLSALVTDQQIVTAWRIGSLVRLSAKYTPWDSSCLTQAMVAKYWCVRFKIPYAVYIGLAKAPEDPSGYKGHAWISAGPVFLTGGNSFAEFPVIGCYVSEGLLNQ